MLRMEWDRFHSIQGALPLS